MTAARVVSLPVPAVVGTAMSGRRGRSTLLSVIALAIASLAPTTAAQNATPAQRPEVIAAGKAMQQQVIDLRRHFHQYPELSNREEQTAKRVAEELRKQAIRIPRVAIPELPLSRRTGLDEVIQTLTPAAAQACCRAVACARRVAVSATLLWYCRQATPASSTGTTRASRRAVSSSSGVIRYRPRAGITGWHPWKGKGSGKPTLTPILGQCGPFASRCPQPTMSTPDPTPSWRSWMCVVCGFVYREAEGMPDEGIAPGTRWEEVPDTWTCPDCGATKSDFEMEPM